MEHPHFEPEHDPSEHEPFRPIEIPIGGTPLEQVSTYLRHAIDAADARDEAIDSENAQAIATLLAALLDDPDAEMQRFAETGQADPTQLRAECQRLDGRSWRTEDIPLWVERFREHLDARENLSAETEVW